MVDEFHGGNTSMLRLTPAQESYVARNGFVVVPSDAFAGIAEVYEGLKEAFVPIFVTTDALLHTAHLVFDYMLRAVEITALRSRLAALTDVLLDASARDLVQATNPDVKEAARRNLAFFSVGARLLDPARQPPAEVADLVQAELKLIEGRRDGIPPPRSPVLGVREDYTQYIPRGHYTRNDAFRTYFLAAMWYGRVGFFVYPSESHGLSQAATERLARQALLITRDLHDQRVGDRAAVDVWRGIYETTALFAGRAEDPGPDEYRTLAQAVYGGLPDLKQLADDARLGAFLARVRELPRPRVLSTYYLDDAQPDSITPRWQDGTLGFHFMPQRFVPDAHILSELVWDRVGSYQGERQPFTLSVSLYEAPYRGIPRGLDVLAAFGSELAGRILREEGDTEYAGYPEKLSALRALYARDELGRDLYHRCLAMLRTLLEPPPKAAPAFARNEAWARKQLNAALGTWAELRHDTILYVKQSYTSAPRGAATPPPSPPAYLEPYPRVYAGLSALVAQMRRALDGWGMLEPGVGSKLAEFEALLVELEGIAERELEGHWPTGPEMEGLAAIGGRLKALLRFPRALMEQITSGTDDRMAVVGDVHTHLAGGEVLEEAVGDPYLICVELEREGQRARYWGAVFSYYEFRHPMDDRLTDEAWQAMSPKPPLPPWTSVFLAEK
jgi:hypothetical protein